MPFSWPFALRGLACTLVLCCGAVVFGAGVTACGTDAEGVDACRKLESVRCERATGCNISLATPAHEGAPDDDVAACKRFYDDACLHGLVSQKNPGAVEVDACLAAIKDGTCDVVRSPGSDPACAFLQEPAPVIDAGSDAGASTDASLEEWLDGASPF